jgi:opacity protein-like surface antigen
MPTKAAPVPYPTVNWTGWYIGAGASYSWGQVDLGGFANPDASGVKPEGVVALLQGGYDYQFANRFVLGARLAIPITKLKDTTFSPVAGTNIRGETTAAAILTGRLGYSMGSWLPYAVAGGVWARGEATSVGVGSADADHTGYIVGLGVETYIARHWTVDVNYTYIDMSKEHYDFTPFGGAVLSYGYHSSNLTLAINYRF